jgi:hypothetical protein
MRHSAIPPTTTVMLALLLAGCTANDTSPMIIAGNQPVQLPRERGYVACVTALYRAIPQQYGLRLHQRYRSKVDEDENVRVFHIEAWMLDQGERQHVRFVCTTEPIGRTRVLTLHRLQNSLPEAVHVVD